MNLWNKKRNLGLQLIVILMVVMLVSVGCSSEDVKPAEEGSVVTDNVSFEDAELIVALPEANNNFDPYASYGNDSYGNCQVYDRLVIKDENGDMVPSIAESFDISPDGMTIKFKIRDDVMFSDGTELKGSDILFSLEKATSSPYTSYGISEIDSFNIVDDYTIEVLLHGPSASFIEKLGIFLYVVSEEAYSKYGDEYGSSLESVIGTGPYILKEWKPGELCVFESNPNYFRGEADIKKLRFKTISDVNAAVIALLTDEVGMYMSSIPGIFINEIEADDDLILTKFPSRLYMFSIMNFESGPFSDARLRKAVAYAVDRDKALVVGAEGEGVKVDSPGGWDYTGNPGENTWYYEQNLEKAKELVREAGMEGETIVLKTYATDSYPKVATALQSDLNKIGLNVEVLQMERNAFIEDVLANGDYEIAICKFGSGTKDMDEVMSSHLGTKNIGISGNWCRYSNPEIDEMLNAARSITDEKQREELYSKIIKIYTDDAVQIPLYYSLENQAYTSDIIVNTDLIGDHLMYDLKWND